MAADPTDEELVSQYRDLPVDRDTRSRLLGWSERRLLVDRCGDCGTFHEPPAPICPVCWSGDVVATEVAGTGTVHLVMWLHQGPPAEGVDYSTPYPVVVVDLDEQEGLRYAGTVLGADNAQIEIGRRVELDWFLRFGGPRPAFRLAAG